MIIRGRLKANEEVIDLKIEGGRIIEVRPAGAREDYDLGGSKLRLAPGWIDLQINGAAGVDWNAPGVTSPEIAATLLRLGQTGMVACLPTVITGAREHIKGCFTTLARAIEEHAEAARAIIGFHLEGPYISPADGPRGAHPKAHARGPDWDEFQIWQEAAGGRIRLITLAPEWPGALSFIERAVSAGIIVALGHTAATGAQIRDAVRAGARLSTHLGNGSHALIERHGGYFWEQLACDELQASLIVDGQHLPPALVKCLVRSKTPARTILVTDAIAAAGLPPGRHRLGEVEVELTSEGRVCLPGTPYLAGSVLALHEAVANVVNYAGVMLDEALEMASANPAALLGLEESYGLIAPGRPAHLVLFRWDDEAKRIEIMATVIDGQIIYQKEGNDERT